MDRWSLLALGAGLSQCTRGARFCVRVWLLWRPILVGVETDAGLVISIVLGRRVVAWQQGCDGACYDRVIEAQDAVVHGSTLQCCVRCAIVGETFLSGGGSTKARSSPTSCRGRRRSRARR